MNADERQRILNFDDWVRWAPGRFAPIAGARAVNTAEESPSWVCLLYVLQDEGEGIWIRHIHVGRKFRKGRRGPTKLGAVAVNVWANCPTYR